eukprot:14141832-Alexandrium_andersonii.AAC.1
MGALFASSAAGFQAIRDAQQATLQAMENYKLEVINAQQLSKTHDSRIVALETAPTGAQSASAGGNPRPAGSPSAFAGEAAAWVGWNRR